MDALASRAGVVMAPGCVWHERYMWHEPGNFAGSLRPEGFIQPGSHVEHPEITRRIQNLLDICGMKVQLTTIAPQRGQLPT